MLKSLFITIMLIPYISGIAMQPPIIIWDNDGTVMGSKDPNDTTRVVLPNVADVMNLTSINIICSGIKTPESALHNWDPIKIMERFKVLMEQLPISMVTFSPAIGGIECWVMIKHATGDIETRKAHEDPRYHYLIGQFKKPGTGMLVVIKNLVIEWFGQTVDATNTIFIGDAWQDQQAAQGSGIPFIDAYKIHTINKTIPLHDLVDLNTPLMYKQTSL